MRKVWKVAGGLLGGAIVIGVLADKGNQPDTSRQAQATTTTSSPSANPQVETTPASRPLSAREELRSMLPPDEAALIAAVGAARQQYASAANDMAKGAARPARAKAVCASLRSSTVNDWVGLV